MPLLGSLGVPADRPLVAFVGTLEPRKGIEPLVAAFDRVARHTPDVVLVLAGQPGWGMADTERALAEARHPDRILRTGYLPDEAVPALLRQAAVSVYPALEEGFGLPALEAMACGAPLVTTEGTAMAEFAQGAALLVPPGDARALADAIDSALEQGRGSDAAAPWHMVAAARTWEASATLHMRAYEVAAGSIAVGFRAMRALITGGKGFVGQWLAAHLKDCGDEVAVIDIETDVADGAAVGRVMADVAPDVVYHLAALTHVGESWENPSQVLRVNVLGTAELLAAARARPAEARILVVSSAEVYGVVTPEQLPLGEDTPTLPASPTRPASWRPKRWRSRRGADTDSRSSWCGRSTTSVPASRPTSSFPRWPSGSSRPSVRAYRLAGRALSPHGGTSPTCATSWPRIGS